MKSRFDLNERSFVVEVASNDGYLLQYFVRQRVPVLGIEPAANVAKVAVEKGVPSLVRFFGTKLAKELAAIPQTEAPHACLRRPAQVKIGGTVGEGAFCRPYISSPSIGFWRVRQVLRIEAIMQNP
jgi:hypothetical protein